MTNDEKLRAICSTIRKMRGQVLILFTLVFTSILAVSPVHAADQKSDATSRNSSWITRRKLLSESKMFVSMVSIRRKRNDGPEEQTNPFPTRHGKHRRRRRCRNRPMCSRASTNASATPTRQLPSLNNDTRTWDENSGQETLYNETRGVGYHLVAFETPKRYEEEEKDKLNAKEKSFAKERSSSAIGNWSKLEIETYDERVLSDEIEFEDVNESSSWMDSPIYTAIDDHVTFHESLGVLLTKLFQSLRNASLADGRDIFKELNFVDPASDEDPCQKWLNSRDKLEKVFLGGLATLPACPCQYPSNIFYDDKIWDESQKKFFRWRDVSGGSQRLDVYKPGAAYCVRSLLTQGSGSAAVQHCCYDRRRNLLTRGSGAGTPNFVSPEISPILHERIDVLPWRLCKGDFSRYNRVRPPNNNNSCEPNPDDEEYQRQIDDTKYY